MAKGFYLIIDGEQSGPVDAAALKQLAASGRLKPSDKIRREDMSEWYVAKNVTGLFTASTQATTQIPAKLVQASRPKSAQGSESPKSKATLSTAETLNRPWRRFKNPWAKAAVFLACCVIVPPIAKFAGGFLGTQMAGRKVARQNDSVTRAEIASLQDDLNHLAPGQSHIFNSTGHKNANGAKLQIFYPRTWRAEDGEGPNTVQRLISDGRQGSRAVLIQTWALPHPHNRELSEAEKIAYLKEGVKEAFGDQEVVSSTFTQIRGETCSMIELQKTLDENGVKIGMKALVYIMVRDGIQIMLTCYVQGDASRGMSTIWREYDNAKPLFQKIVESIVFLDRPDASPNVKRTLDTAGNKINPTPSSPEIQESFIKVQLDHGMNLSIPTSWNVFDKDLNSLIRQSSQALQGDISGMSEGGLSRTTILRMTCNPKHLYGSLAINVYHDRLIPPEDIIEIAKSPELLEQMKEAFINEALGSKSISLVGESDISSLKVAGHPAVRVDYQRKGIMDDHVVQVHLTRIFLADKTYSIMSSYRVIEKELLAPILDASINSISFGEVKGLRHPEPSLPPARTPQSTQASLDQALIEVSKSLNEGLPVQVDKETRLDSTTAGPGNRLTYHYTLVNYTKSGLDVTAFTAAVKPGLVDLYRNNPEMATFREMQVELHYNYRDKDGTNVATIIVSPRDL